MKFEPDESVEVIRRSVVDVAFNPDPGFDVVTFLQGVVQNLEAPVSIFIY